MSEKLDFGIVYPLWNHSRAEVSLLERVAGEVGLDHVTLPVVTGEFYQFRPFHFPAGPFFHTEGGWHYHPETRHYANCGFRPRAAKWIGTRQTLEPVLSEARRIGLRVSLNIDPANVAALVDEHPSIRQVDAWGSADSCNRPCLMHPGLRELIAATFVDLRRFEPDGVQLVNPLLDGPARERWIGAPASYYRHWSCWCFCSSCRQAGAREGLDVEALASEVRSACVTELLDPKLPRAYSISRPPSPGLVAYRAARWRDVSTWLMSLRQQYADMETQLVRSRFEEWPWQVTALSEQPWPVVLYAASDWYDADLENKIENAPSLKYGVQGVQTTVWGSEVARPANELVQKVATATQFGVRFFDFINLEESPTDAITWLKQAVRYARRETDLEGP